MKRTYKTIKIDVEWIKENIVKPGWQRNLYIARVNNFVNKIRNEEFIKSLITVAKDKRNGKYILLDGQHKIEAIAKSERTFEMDVCIYEDLDEEEQIKVYTMLNDVKPPRLIDDLKTYIGRHGWLDAFLNQKNFPINITFNGGVNSMRIDSLLNVLHNGMRNTISRNNLTRKKLPTFLEELGASEYALMKEFCQFYKECFGEPSQDNWLYKNIVMFTMFRIWNANKDNFKKDVMVECFKRVETKPEIRQQTYVGDITTLEILTKKIYRTINYKRSANYFVIFWDEELKLN